MKRRLMILGLCLGFASVLVVGATLLIPRAESAIRKENYDKVEIGHSQSYVERLLGGRPRDESPRPLWILSTQGLDEFEIVSGALTPDLVGWPSASLWASDRGVVAVIFDGESRVIHRHFRPVRPAKSSWLDKVRGWLGV
jgi:hypothetical protein